MALRDGIYIGKPTFKKWNRLTVLESEFTWEGFGKKKRRYIILEYADLPEFSQQLIEHASNAHERFFLLFKLGDESEVLDVSASAKPIPVMRVNELMKCRVKLRVHKTLE